MKFTATKKAIVILTVSFLILALGIISLVYKDYITKAINTGRWFTLDRYEELLEDCEYSKKGGTIRVNCNALIVAVKKDKVGHCHNLLVIGTDKTRELQKVVICEEDEKIDTENVKSKYQLLTPVNMEVVYNKKGSLFKYSFSNITMKNMDEVDILLILEEDSRLNELNERIDREHYNMDFYNYFYFQESSGSWHESHGLQYISFVSADLEEMSVDGEYLVVRIRTIVRNQEVVLKSRVKGFNYYNEETNTTHYVTPENIDAFTDLIGKRIIPNFLYSQRQRTAEERVIMVNTCNYRGDREGGINAKILYTPICSNWDLYASLDTEGVLSKDVYANYILGQEDLNNVDMNSISPLYKIMLE